MPSSKKVNPVATNKTTALLKVLRSVNADRQYIKALQGRPANDIPYQQAKKKMPSS